MEANVEIFYCTVQIKNCMAESHFSDAVCPAIVTMLF